MDTNFKVAPYSDVHDSLEKGCPTAEPLLAQPEQTHPRRFVAKRHWIAFGALAFTWLVFSYGKRAFHGHLAHHGADDRAGRPFPPDHDIDQCVGRTNWTTYYDQPPWTPEYPHGAETTFSLPLDSDALFLISRGIFQGGLVNIEQSTQVADTVDVRVRVAYSNDKLLDLASVCQIERAEREYGIGIFTPKAPSRLYHESSGLEFDITLTLPAGNEDPLFVKKLETKMPNYSQDVAKLGESVLFDQISLISANGKLSVQSVTSVVGEFSSLNGEIDGHFNAQSSLNLHTANGGITPTVNLLQREGAAPPHLEIRTMNGEVDAEISLTSEALIGGEFEVDAQSHRGGIGLKFTSTPVDSVLRCHAETTVGSVQVELDSAFEGTYSLENVLGAKVVAQHDVEDPAGRGRRRIVSVNETHGQLHGELKWVGDDGSSAGNEGSVVVKSVMSSVRLVV